MQRLIFLIICTLLLLKPTANAVFIAGLGVDNLPFIYVAVAITAFFVSTYYSNFTLRYSPKSLFVYTSYTSIVLLIAIGILMVLNIAQTFSIIVFYLFMSIFGILSASQFWILANQLFDAREARKYFGIIGLGAIGGGIAGGYLASLVSAVFESEWLPFVAAGLLVLALFVVDGIKWNTKPVPY